MTAFVKQAAGLKNGEKQSDACNKSGEIDYGK